MRPMRPFHDLEAQAAQLKHFIDNKLADRHDAGQAAPSVDDRQSGESSMALVLLGGSSSSSATASAEGADTFSDGASGSDTDMTSSEESEWVFKVTPAMMRRLSLIPQAKSVATLPTLPAELQLEIFSHLDKIDSVAFGLTSRQSYNIYRAIYGTKMPLNTRRIGPNSLESAWEVVGKQECKQCGMFRCELWQHIKTWMPQELEYCTMKQNFGSRARPGAAESCYRGKPSKPRRCGRHPIRTTTIHQDDNVGSGSGSQLLLKN